MNIEHRRENGFLIVSPQQDIDLEASGEFERVVLRLAETGLEKVILDCTVVAYIDSSGIGAIVRIHRYLKERGGRLIISGGNEHLLKVFKLINFPKYFRLTATIEEAMAD